MRIDVIIDDILTAFDPCQVTLDQLAYNKLLCSVKGRSGTPSRSKAERIARVKIVAGKITMFNAWS